MFKILVTVLLATALVILVHTDAQACDSLRYNNFFTMADSAERVLVVRGTSDSKGEIIRALKGGATPGLPAMNSSCDPRLSAGLQYLVFVGPGGNYYSDSSAFALLGDQGKSWTRTAADWIRTKNERARSKILERALDFEFAMPAIYGGWTMLNEIAKLPMPHPTIDRIREAKLKSELLRRQAISMPKGHSLSWFRSAKRANAIVLLRASPKSQAVVVETIAGADSTSRKLRVGSTSLLPGVKYLALLDEKAATIDELFIVSTTQERKIVDFVRRWAKRGKKDIALRSFVQRHLAGSSKAHPLAYDAASELAAKKKLNQSACQTLRRHYAGPEELTKAIKETCSGA